MMITEPDTTALTYTHPDPYAKGELCGMCRKPATHKVAEETEDYRHPFTSYVCCDCFGRIMGRVAARACSESAAASRGEARS